MKNYIEMTENVLRRSEDFEVAKVRKKKIIGRTVISLSCFFLIIGIGFGIWQSGLSESPDPLAPDDTEGFASGGEGNFDYERAYAPKLYQLDSDLMNYIIENGGTDLEEWLAEETEETKKSKYNISDPEHVPGLIRVIEKYDIPKEDFEKINNNRIAIYKEMGQDSLVSQVCYTQEEVDALYSNDDAFIARVFASKYAIISEDKAFAPRFYLNAPAEELSFYGITQSMITDKIQMLLANEVIEPVYPSRSNFYSGYELAYVRKLYGLNQELLDYIMGTNHIDMYDWLEKKTLEVFNSEYGFSTSETPPTVILAIETFNIPKEEFERINNERIAVYERANEPYHISQTCYTQEEIDALYSNDDVLITRVFASKYTVVSGGKAFAAGFYLNASEKELNDYDITDSMIKEKADLLVADSIIEQYEID